jgi:hypothetical protein
MEPLDASFVDIFLDFLNDKKADARKVEKAFFKHEYVQNGIGVFQGSRDKVHYKELQADMRSELLRLLKEKGRYPRQAIADHLNRLPLEIPITEGVTLKISGIVVFESDYKGIRPTVRYAVNGVEYACWYALAIVSREPKKIIKCAWRNCTKLWNTQTKKRPSFCGKSHQRAAEKENNKTRSWNSRHPHDKREIPYLTIPKPRLKK